MENENPFKKLGQPQKEVPQEVKARVMDDIAVTKFVMETASLFSTNYAKTLASFFEKRKVNKKTE